MAALFKRRPTGWASEGASGYSHRSGPRPRRRKVRQWTGMRRIGDLGSSDIAAPEDGRTPAQPRLAVVVSRCARPVMPGWSKILGAFSHDGLIRVYWLKWLA